MPQSDAAGGRAKARIHVCCHTLPSYRNAFLRELIRELADEAELTVLYGESYAGKAYRPAPDPAVRTLALPVRELKLLGFHLAWQRGLFPVLRRERPDAIVLLIFPGILNHLLMGLRLPPARCPLALWSCGFKRPFIQGWRLRLKDFFLDRINLKADLHITYGHAFARALREQGVPAERIHVAQNTLDTAALARRCDALDRGAVRAACGLDPEDLVLLYVGVLLPDKNLGAALRALPGLRRAHPRLVLWVVGDGPEGPALRALADSLGLGGAAVFHGAVYEGTERFFAAADAFLMPGSGGLAVVEALACGLPVLAGPGDGTVPDLLDEGVDGFLLEDASPEAVHAAVTRFAALPAARRLEMGAAGRRIVAERASLAGMVGSFAAALRHLLALLPEPRSGAREEKP